MNRNYVRAVLIYSSFQHSQFCLIFFKLYKILTVYKTVFCKARIHMKIRLTLGIFNGIPVKRVA